MSTSPATSPGAAPAEARTARPLVLYVDDERANRVVFEQGLPELNIRTVSSGPEALAVMEAQEVAVLVTDMRMAPMSGEELLRAAKQRYPAAIRIVVTAYSDVGPILGAINEGLVARYIVKPWERSEVVQVLRWACEAWAFSRDSAALHQRLLETERMATLGSMAGMLVHDLKQPLTSLLINIEHLGELARAAPVLRAAIANLPSITAPERERLELLVDDLGPLTVDLKASGSHLSDLVHNLRDLSRPREGASTQPATMDPLTIVRHAIAMCQDLAQQVRAQIGYEGPDELPPVGMASTELMQVLVNVVANGAQAVAARGAAHGRVVIQARATADRTLELQVRDNGVGMPPDVLDRAGTPFFTTRTDGTGLGIAQCHRLVGAAGGRFLIESESGVGTTVTITLPLV